MAEISLVAMDLDGTFLTDVKRFNEAHFDRILQLLAAQDARFIVASGRDEEQIDKHFKRFAGRYDLVADNGAIVKTADGQTLKVSGLEVPEVATMMQVVTDLPFDPRQGALFTGRHGVYMLRDQGRLNLAHQSLVLMMFAHVTMIDSLAEIDEPILKVTIGYAEHQTNHFIQAAQQALGSAAHVTTSGYGSVDIVAPDVNKANGIKVLADYYGVTADQSLVAFGDGLNDAEMLALAAQPYAMKNGDDSLLERYPAALDDNNNDGVLLTLDEILRKQ